MLKTKRKSLLYQSKVEYADFCLNHVEGCSHGCTFPCYAMQMAKRFGKVNSYADWIKPKLVENALELLDEEIPKYKDMIRFVHLCFMTDPFMYSQPEVKKMTLKIIEKLSKNDIRSTVLTKGILPRALVNTDKYGKSNEYGITLVSLNNEFRKQFEPFSAPYEKRIESLRYLHEAGLSTWASIEPYPTPNLDECQDLQKLLNELDFVDKLVFGKLNYNVESTQYKDNSQFYENCANTVLEFCEKRGIGYHIKCGTQKKYNMKTETIFKRVCTPPAIPV